MTDTHQRLEAYYHRYAERMGRHLEALEDRSRRLGWFRLATVLAGGAAAWWAFATLGDGGGLAVAAGALAVFFVLARLHRRVEHSRKRHRLWQQLKEAHGARLRRDWDALPPPLARRPDAAPPPDEAHPFAPGLNVTGAHSLVRLIDTCATSGGSRHLRRWLLEPVPRRADTLHRQAMVKELVPRAGLRDRLALEGRLTTRLEAGERWSDRPLRSWLEGDTDAAPLLPWIAGLGALAVANAGLVVLHVAGVLPPLWAATVPLYLLLYTFQLPAVKGVFDEAEELMQAFRPLRAVLRFLEERPLAGCPRLRELLAPLRTAGHGPSQHIARVGRVAAAASSQRSELLALVNLLGPWDLTVAYLLRRERARLREDLPRWLDVWYRLEALSALAAMADRRPDSTFPTIEEDDHQPVFVGEGMGHPLLPETEKVRNSVRFAASGAIALITGSNMAGKSTFLRTLGLNLCLAFAGGPVDARALHTVPFRLFTCINVTDAVTGGLSYFYAEVRRLKALMEALKAEDGPPLFYLIDEIFRGTNNRERLIGSRAYLRALAEEQGGVGAVATHDLELTELAGEIPQLENYHFRETVEGERMSFDYRLRPGPCPTTNALKIMRAAGLPTDGFEERASGRAAATEHE